MRSAVVAVRLGTLLAAVLALGAAAPLEGVVAAPRAEVLVPQAQPVATATIVGSVRRTSAWVNARGHPTLSSKVLFVVPAGTAIRVYRVARDGDGRSWYLVHVKSRPGWIAGWLTKVVARRAAPIWHVAMASSFGVGDGLLGNGMACGSRLTSSVMAVAHRTFRCGTRVRIKVGRSVVVARVMDRGPYVSGRTFDLAPAVCRALHSCRGAFRIEWQLVR